MRSQRISETRVLGYPIDRLDEYDDAGLLRLTRFEVLCPRRGAVLASFPDLRAARRYVLVQELRNVASDRLRAGQIRVA